MVLAGDPMLRLCSSTSFALIAAAVLGASTPLSAQWLKYPTADVPRTADGKPHLKAPTPRTPDGKPDFSGMWLTADGPPCNRNPAENFIECGIELPISVLGFN